MNEEIKLPEPDVYPIGGIRSYSAKAVRAAILADRAARPVAKSIKVPMEPLAYITRRGAVYGGHGDPARGDRSLFPCTDAFAVPAPESEDGYTTDYNKGYSVGWNACREKIVSLNLTARPVADAGEAVAWLLWQMDARGEHIATPRVALTMDEAHGMMDEYTSEIQPVFARAAPSARTLSEDEIRDIADDFKGEFRCAGTTFETFDSLGFARALLAASAPAEAPSVRDELATVHKFLLGDGALDGFYFGDSDTARPRKAYWWREHLRRALQGKPEAPSTCAWTQADNENSIWDSACGETWSFNEGGPVENAIKFCQGCGKSVHIAPEAPKGGNCD